MTHGKDGKKAPGLTSIWDPSATFAPPRPERGAAQSLPSSPRSGWHSISPRKSAVSPSEDRDRPVFAKSPRMACMSSLAKASLQPREQAQKSADELQPLPPLQLLSEDEGAPRRPYRPPSQSVKARPNVWVGADRPGSLEKVGRRASLTFSSSPWARERATKSGSKTTTTRGSLKGSIDDARGGDMRGASKLVSFGEEPMVGPLVGASRALLDVRQDIDECSLETVLRDVHLLKHYLAFVSPIMRRVALFWTQADEFSKLCVLDQINVFDLTSSQNPKTLFERQCEKARKIHREFFKDPEFCLHVPESLLIGLEGDLFPSVMSLHSLTTVFMPAQAKALSVLRKSHDVAHFRESDAFFRLRNKKKGQLGPLQAPKMTRQKQRPLHTVDDTMPDSTLVSSPPRASPPRSVCPADTDSARDTLPSLVAQKFMSLLPPDTQEALEPPPLVSADAAQQPPTLVMSPCTPTSDSQPIGLPVGAAANLARSLSPSALTGLGRPPAPSPLGRNLCPPQPQYPPAPAPALQPLGSTPPVVPSLRMRPVDMSLDLLFLRTTNAATARSPGPRPKDSVSPNRAKSKHPKRSTLHRGDCHSDEEFSFQKEAVVHHSKWSNFKDAIRGKVVSRKPKHLAVDDDDVDTTDDDVPMSNSAHFNPTELDLMRSHYESIINGLKRKLVKRMTRDSSSDGVRVNTARVTLLDRIAVGGSSAQVYIANVDGWECVMKQLDIDEGLQSVQGFLEEIRMLEGLPSHPNIVNYLFHQVTAEYVRLFMTKYSSNLAEFIQNKRMQSDLPLPPTLIKKCMVDIVSGVAYLHSHHIVHRDLKSANVFIQASSKGDILTCCVGDLDISKDTASRGVCQTIVGTPGFMAPEVLEAGPYSYAADIFSTGMLLFELLNLRLPYHELKFFEVSNAVLENKLPTHRDHVARPPYAVFEPIFSDCCAFNPANRPTGPNLLKRLNALDFQEQAEGT